MWRKKYPTLAAEQLYTNCKKGLSSALILRHGIIFFQVIFPRFLFEFKHPTHKTDNHRRQQKQKSALNWRLFASMLMQI